MIGALVLLALAGPADGPPLQTPTGLRDEDPGQPTAPEEDAATDPAASEQPEPSDAPVATEPAPAEDPSSAPDVEPHAVASDAAAADEPPPEDEASEGDPAKEEKLHVAAGAGGKGPPFYSEADMKALRARYDIAEPSTEPPRKARWRCLIADPTCGINFEVNATAAYAYRVRQGDVRTTNLRRWSSGRAQYDFWLNFPVLVETEGRQRFTKITFGPKGGVIFSDTGDLWGNLGIAFRYWLGRGKWAPTIEVTSALSYKIGSRPTRDLGGQEPEFRMTRGPVGFTADVGFGLGGFGAIVIGGQYDSPLAREEVPESFRVSTAGMFFVGFRGNILWGGPAAAAVLTHGLTQRYVEAP